MMVRDKEGEPRRGTYLMLHANTLTPVVHPRPLTGVLVAGLRVSAIVRPGSVFMILPGPAAEVVFTHVGATAAAAAAFGDHYLLKNLRFLLFVLFPDTKHLIYLSFPFFHFTHNSNKSLSFKIRPSTGRGGVWAKRKDASKSQEMTESEN